MQTPGMFNERRSEPIGEQLRDWRQRRRLSQLALATSAGVSQRHVSFVESGRAMPSRELVLTLARHLDVPFRERNQLLLAAGFAPIYRERPLDAPELAPARAAIELVLSAYDDEDYVVEALEAGASGYLLKSAQGSDVASAIRSVAGGQLVLHPAVARHVLGRPADRRHSHGAVRCAAPVRRSKRRKRVMARLRCGGERRG